MTTEQILYKLRNDGRIKHLIDEFIRSSSNDMARFRLQNERNIWRGNESIKVALEEKLRGLNGSLKVVMKEMIREAWELSEKENDRFVMNYLQAIPIATIGADFLLRYFNRIAPSEKARKAVTLQNILSYDRNTEGLRAFLKNDLKLSKRVWRVTTSTKQAIRHYLAEGLADGRSSALISQDVRKFLQHPETRFRRVRDPETGKLKLSKPMANFHPGRGVYRSAYKNAWRLARTEVSRAYQVADNARWQKLNFVTGFEVRLSANHPESDECDALAGRYPKSFIFSCWHPQCICFALPITLNKKDFARYLDTGKLSHRHFTTRIPGSASDWIRNNQSKIIKAPGKPYWVDDNFKIENQSLKLNLK